MTSPLTDAQLERLRKYLEDDRQLHGSNWILDTGKLQTAIEHATSVINTPKWVYLIGEECEWLFKTFWSVYGVEAAALKAKLESRDDPVTTAMRAVEAYDDKFNGDVQKPSPPPPDGDDYNEIMSLLNIEYEKEI
jgi:phage gp29-like protein